jgi:uncharacterized protein (UPF0548 family)
MGLISLRKPSADSLRRFLSAQRHFDYNYEAVGATEHTPPAGFVVDRTGIELGRGEAAFIAAKEALERWEQFQLGWVEAWPCDAPLQSGELVAVLGRAIGLWWLNACRIIYTIDGLGPLRRFGFAYGTLPGHVASGEERFLIQWDQATDIVRYDILAFSRPNHFLIKLGYPLVRRSQKRFGRDSATAMFRAVNGAAPLAEVCQATG